MIQFDYYPIKGTNKEKLMHANRVLTKLNRTSVMTVENGTCKPKEIVHLKPHTNPCSVRERYMENKTS